jgi:hypothetical protein
MKQRKVETVRITLVMLFVLVVGITVTQAGKQKYLNRSFYVPVHFRVCEHLDQGVLYIGETAVALLPTERVFQFTFYPSLNRLEPPVTDVRVEAINLHGERVSVPLAISPKAIGTPNRAIDLDLKKHLKKLGYKIDVRYKEVKLLIQCKICGGVASSEAQAEVATKGEPGEPGNEH